MNINEIEKTTEKYREEISRYKPRVLKDSWTTEKQIEEIPALAPPYV